MMFTLPYYWDLHVRGVQMNSDLHGFYLKHYLSLLMMLFLPLFRLILLIVLPVRIHLTYWRLDFLLKADSGLNKFRNLLNLRSIDISLCFQEIIHFHFLVSQVASNNLKGLTDILLISKVSKFFEIFNLKISQKSTFTNDIFYP